MADVPKWSVPAFTALFLALWFGLLGHRDLIDPDEGRYAEIPREMVVTGDWLTPRLDGLKYFEKPPLPYWMTAICFALFGTGNGAARLPIALIGLAGVLWTGYLTSALYGKRASVYAMLMTASGLLYCGASHYLTVDITVSVFIVIGVGCLVLAQRQRDEASAVRGWMLAGWAALAAAVLSKGLIGVVLPGGAVAIYLLWQRDWALLRHLHLGKGIALLLLLTAPWFLYMSRTHAEFAHFFFVHEHFERYTTDVHGREGPAWYFLVIFVAGVAPWVSTSIASLVLPDFLGRDPGRGTPQGEFDAERFLWVFILFVLLFFSVGDSKLPAYILPVFPFVAVLAAKRIDERGSYLAEPWILLVLAVVVFVTGLEVTRLATETIPMKLYEAYRPWILASALVLLLGSAVLFLGRARPVAAMAGASLSAVLALELLLWGFQTIAPSRSGRELAEAIRRDAAPDTPVYLVGTHMPSLPFYLGRLVTMVDYRGELALGVDAEPAKSIADPRRFVELWRDGPPALAIFSHEDLTRYREVYGLPVTVVESGYRRTLVSNVPAGEQGM